MWYNSSMKKVTVTFVWDEELKVYSAYLADVPVCGEGATKEKALQSLKEGLMFYIEEEGKDALLSHIIGPMEYEEVDLAQLV